MLSQKQIQKAMKRLGIQSEEISANEVVIKCDDKDIIIREPAVSKIKMGGQETFQIVGVAEEQKKEKFTEDDVNIVVEQSGCSREEAKKVLEETGDIAEAIMKLKNI